MLISAVLEYATINSPDLLNVVSYLNILATLKVLKC